MEIYRLLRFFIAMLLIVCFAPSGNSYTDANNSSTTVRSPPNTETPSDEVDEVRKAARAAIEIINQHIKEGNDEILELTTSKQALIDRRPARKANATEDEEKARLADEQRWLADLEEAASLLKREVKRGKDLMKAIPVFKTISQDKIQAAKLIEFVHSNDRSALSGLLKHEAPGSNVDVREVKDVNGLMVIFRIGKLNHCLSTKQGCGGKPYSVTK